MRSRGTTTTRGLGPARGRGVAGGVIATVLVGIAGLAGCTGDDDPAPAPPATSAPAELTPSPTPTPTPTPTDPAAVPPERPSAMDTVDTAGAVAVATYFLEMFGYVFATNDLSTWQALSHPDCVLCASVVDRVTEQASAGIHSVGGLSTVTEASALEVDPGKWWTVDADLIQAPSTGVNADGVVVDEAPDTVTYHMDVAVVFEGDRWLVREVSYTETARERR